MTRDIKLFLLVVIFLNILNAQRYYDQQTGEEYEITQQTDQKIIHAFLKENKAKAIEFNPDRNSNYPLRIKNRRGNWVLYDSRQESFIFKEEGKRYSFEFPDSHLSINDLAIAHRKKKKYLVNLMEEEIFDKISFDQFKPIVAMDTLHRYNEQDELEPMISSHITSIAIQSNEKWGLVELSGEVYLSRNYLYDFPEDIPAATGFQGFQLEMMENLRKDRNLDQLVELDDNGYHFKGRKRKSKLWGVYSGEGVARNDIPAEYEKIVYHNGSSELYEVWKDGKVGYYNRMHELVFEPEFEDLVLFNLDYTYGCALKKDGKWQLYYVDAPKKMVEGQAETLEGLRELWLNR
ncbi:hypothetical protein BST97_04845 [Nonlabens spongiae]|uniref:WG repeat-containing protein n=1 Tax=Nonlabens spongiae TaxID=331648 RepID=A0A1W6MIE7_9FLAO|nr:hypothetical protein [Nonlabens spongiae]ARN77362.1 hypothetical protein BST97_04845 [Nonlabens spongiae]